MSGVTMVNDVVPGDPMARWNAEGRERETADEMSEPLAADHRAVERFVAHERHSRERDADHWREQDRDGKAAPPQANRDDTCGGDGDVEREPGQPIADGREGSAWQGLADRPGVV